MKAVNQMRSILKKTRFVLGAGALVLVSSLPSFAQNASQYFPIAPCRLYDSRFDGPQTPLVGQDTPGRQLSIKGTCGIPNDASALSYNVTIVRPTGNGFLTMYPSNAALPEVSSINFKANDVRGNGGVVPLAPGAPDLNVYLATNPAAGSGHVILDATGYFKEVPE